MNFNQKVDVMESTTPTEAANDAVAQQFALMVGRPKPDDSGEPKQPVFYNASSYIEFGGVLELVDFVRDGCDPRPSNWDAMPASDRRNVKNALPYVFWPLAAKGGSKNRDDNTRRNPNIAPAKWLAFDVDGCGEDIFSALIGYDFGDTGLFTGGELANYRAFAYTSSSDKPGDRHFRFIIELAEPVAVADKQTTALAIEHRIFSAVAEYDPEASAALKGKNAWRMGDQLAIVDGAQYRIAQVAYLPFSDADLCQGYDGQALALDDVTAFDDLPEAFKTRKGRTSTGEAYQIPENFKAAVDADPRAQWLIDNDYVTGDNGRNALHVRCPNWQNHSDADTRDYSHGDTGSAYMLHDSDPMQRLLTCQHASCAELVSNQYEYAKLFNDPAMPDELLPVDIRANVSFDEFEVIEDEDGAPIEAAGVRANPQLTKSPDSDLAKLILRNLKHAAVDAESGFFYRYDENEKSPTFGTWQILKENVIKRFIASVFNAAGAPYNSAKLNAVTNVTFTEAPTLKAPQNGLISFANGTYDLRSEKFTPHSPQNWLTTTNGIVWSDAEGGESLEHSAPVFYSWLEWVSEGNKAKKLAVLALFYAVLTNRYEWQKFYELTGEGGSGKGTAMLICEMLAGKGNAVSMETALLDDARGRAPLVGKSFITLPDQKQYVGDGSGLRGITGGDNLLIDPKNKAPFSMIIRAVIVAANNSPMTFTERNGGINRRRVLFIFNRVVAEAKRDRKLPEKIAAELPVIVRALVAKFPAGKGAEAALIEQMNSADARAVKNDSDPLNHFASLCDFGEQPDGLALSAPDDAKWKREDLVKAEEFCIYSAYLKFCETIGAKPLGLVAFRNGMKQAAKVNNGLFLSGSRRRRKWGAHGGLETATNVIYKPELSEFVPSAFPDDLAISD